ncbi:MFS domain-containing protein [Meloidogyne graminicola]|uniref:MFS domain-containing protein n=1 Tax=Meloidogyne graminicola TaxID=189291 RepID=A0A8S9ZUG7_9BILA|nr:MFS domain-containing protein [Meloidogyne graminicola]
MRILTGVGQGFHLPSMASIVSRHLTASDKGRVFGICLAGSHFGSIIAGGIGSLLIDFFGWRSLFHFVGLISFIWYLFFERLTDSIGRRTRVVFDSGGSSLENESLTESDLFIKKRPSKGVEIAPTVPWSKLFKHPSFWAASLAQYCGANAYFTMFRYFFNIYLNSFFYFKAFVYNVVPSLAIVFTSLFAPYFASKLLTHGFTVTFTRRFMESVSLMGMAICLLLVSLSSEFSVSLTLFTLAMAVRGLHHAGVSVNPHDFAPDHTGSVFGIFNAFSAITGFIGVYVAGLILHSSNNYWAYVFIFTAFQCIIGAIIYGIKGTGNRII